MHTFYHVEYYDCMEKLYAHSIRSHVLSSLKGMLTLFLMFDVNFTQKLQ